MKDFVAIDFETANYEPTSICSVGLVVVRGGEITQRMHRLVCPEPNRYYHFLLQSLQLDRKSVV